MKTHRRREQSWSELPPELLPAIAKRLETRADILHFRRVCQTWRASVPLSLLDSKTILTPLLPHKLPDDSEKNHTKFLVAHSVFLIKSVANPNLPPWLFTAEELFPGSLCVRLPLSRNIADDIVMPNDFPSKFDLSKFRVLELGMFYNYSYVDSDNTSFGSDVRVIDNPVFRTMPSFPHEYKIVLFKNPNCETDRPSLDDCIIVELSNEIALTVRSLKSGEKRKVYFIGNRKIDDIVSFKGKIYGVDRKGRVCSMDYNTLKMSSVVEEPLWEGSGSENKKRLVVSSDDDVLYLVYRWSKKGNAAFKVFRLNEVEEKWDMVDGIGSDRMLFVTPDGCFFAAVKDFPGWRGNCIVFPWGSFPQYSGKTALDSKIFMAWDEFTVAVYHFEGGDCDPVYVYPGYADLFWPPPSWLWTDVCLKTSGMDSERGKQRKDEESVKSKVEVKGGGGGGDGEQEGNNKLQSDFSCHIAPELIHEEVIPPNGAQMSKGVQTNQEFIAHKEFKDQKIVDSVPTVNFLLKIAEKDVSQKKFLGVDVSAHLIPILQKIWDKYGNIIEGHAVNSGSLLTWALESLAKMVIFLENNEGRSLDDSQANYLNSVLLDLRLMHFKLDWLMPSVEKVLAPHKNKFCMEHEKANLEFQTEFHWMEEILGEQTKLVSESQKDLAEGPCPVLDLISFLDKH